jgi:hypothetical protein
MQRIDSKADELYIYQRMNVENIHQWSKPLYYYFVAAQSV